MIGFAEAVGMEPRWFGRPVTKPGHGEPEPVKPVYARDPPENVAVCLSCPAEGECRPHTKDCPLYGKEKYSAKRAEILERDNKIRDLLNAGWVNTEAICEELKISKSTFFSAKKRLRERGEI